MKIIVFYLPQFHEIPENNMWWGKGFTEWVNTKKAKSLFPGHYQPRLPINNNYYNLLDDSVMVKQMKLARKYGIEAFCFYHYWFGGKKLLEKPVEKILENKASNLSFCLAWANEPWTRTWDGISGEKEVLMPQSYGDEEDWKNHFNYLIDFFMDERYLCVDGKPVFLIYRAQSIPKCNKMMELWKMMAEERGLRGIYFVQMVTSFGADKYNMNFEADVDFEPMRTIYGKEEPNHKVKWKKQIDFYNKFYKVPILSKFLLNIIDYDSVYETILNRRFKGKRKTFYGAFSDWDNTPRKNRRGLIIKGASPKKFEKYLAIQIKRSLQSNNEFLFINAWNEWGEGAYIEPDKKYGYRYLSAIKNALEHNKIMK